MKYFSTALFLYKSGGSRFFITKYLKFPQLFLLVIAFLFVSEVGYSACPISTSGDINQSGQLSLGDASYLVNYIFGKGPDPKPFEAAGDVNCDGSVTMIDAVYLINYLLKSGKAPCDICAYLGLPPPNLPWEIGPIEGLTTIWHRAPSKTAIPLGTKVQLRVNVPAEAKVNWLGATEISRTSSNSTAECRFDQLGTFVVKTECVLSNGEKLEYSSTFEVIDVMIDAIKLKPVLLSVEPVELDENSSNLATMKYFFGSSIAALRQAGENKYRTSVNRTITATVKVEPQEFAPLLEWRINGVARKLGDMLELFGNEWNKGSPYNKTRPANVGGESMESALGVNLLSVGPIQHPQEIEIEIYKVKITGNSSGSSIIPEGQPITFTAVTEPPGYEDEITWLSSTKFGTAKPVLGYGPSFTVQFDDTFEPYGWQWIGVKADNAQIGQDQSCQSPFSISYDGADHDLITNVDTVIVPWYLIYSFPGNETSFTVVAKNAQGSDIPNSQIVVEPGSKVAVSFTDAVRYVARMPFLSGKAALGCVDLVTTFGPASYTRKCGGMGEIGTSNANGIFSFTIQAKNAGGNSECPVTFKVIKTSDGSILKETTVPEGEEKFLQYTNQNNQDITFKFECGGVVFTNDCRVTITGTLP